MLLQPMQQVFRTKTLITPLKLSKKSLSSSKIFFAKKFAFSVNYKSIHKLFEHTYGPQ